MAWITNKTQGFLIFQVLKSSCLFEIALDNISVRQKASKHTRQHKHIRIPSPLAVKDSTRLGHRVSIATDLHDG
jgi:hypothetical protein